MPELAEVEHYRRQWDAGLGETITGVALHREKRIFRGTDLAALEGGLTGATLQRSEARGKQMLFVAQAPASGEMLWLGLHLGMTGRLRIEEPGFHARKADHLILLQPQRQLVFEDARLFGRVLFAQGSEPPRWWTRQPPELLSPQFTRVALQAFLQRRAKAPLKAVLLMQERFPGIGNWMADEILWRAGIHPRQAAGSLDSTQVAALYRETRAVCRAALKIIGEAWGDPPSSWLFPHRWEKGGTCPRTGSKLEHATIGGRTTCWSPARQKLRRVRPNSAVS